MTQKKFIIIYNISVVCIKSTNIQGAMDTGAITLAGIVQFFKDYQNAIRKGKLKFNSGFVLGLRVNNLTINAKRYNAIL